MEIFDTLTLAGVIETAPTLDAYWLSFFPNEITFDTEEILFDVVAKDKKLAPFVAPNVQGRVIGTRGYTTKTFRPAYIKPKDAINPNRAFKRRAGEQPIVGGLSLAQRYEAAVTESMLEQSARIDNRLEWMAAMAVIYGYVDVSGEDYPQVRVDFGRDASLTAALAGAALWSATATADPLGDIEDMRTRAYKLAKSPITRLTFGLDAWAAFTANEQVRGLLNTFYKGSSSEFNRAIGDGTPQQYRGNIAGQNGMGNLELYTYADSYTADDGTDTLILNSKDVVGTGPGMQGTQCFGAIMDFDAGLVATRKFPKMWENKDPSVAYTMTQSAPLMVPAQPNSAFRLTVL
jgi:hypothetical protein